MSRRAPAPARRSARLPAFLVDVLLLLAAAWLLLRPGGPLREELDAWRAERRGRAELRARWGELTGTGGTLGAAGPDAPVVVEFTDYRCPFCARAQSVVDGLLGDGAHARVVVRHLPVERLHPDAPRLAAVAVCAEGDPAFPAIHRALFRAPAPPEAGGAGDPDLEALLREAGAVDPAGLLRCARSASAIRRVRADVALALALGVDGTPTFLTRRAIVPGVLSAGRLREMLGLPDP